VCLVPGRVVHGGRAAQGLRSRPSAEHSQQLTQTLLNNLATVLMSQFAHRAAAADLDEAISLLRRPADFSGESADPAALSNLCAALSERFEISGDPQDIHDAVTAGRRALSLTGAGDWMRQVRPSNLSAALRTRYEAGARGRSFPPLARQSAMRTRVSR